MTNKQYVFIHFTSYLTIIHGVIYWIVKDFMGVESEYGLRPHWFQTYAQAIHILLSPLLVISFGMLWKDHILKFFKAKTKKLISGVTLTVSMIIIILSGYLIQVLYEPSLKSIAVWAHLILSALYLMAYVRHHALSFKKLFKH